MEKLNDKWIGSVCWAIDVKSPRPPRTPMVAKSKQEANQEKEREKKDKNYTKLSWSIPPRYSSVFLQTVLLHREDAYFIVLLLVWPLAGKQPWKQLQFQDLEPFST